MFYTPRFSYGTLKTVICACTGDPGTGVPFVLAGDADVRDGWVPGWVYRVGTGRAIPGTTQPSSRGAVPVQRSGPRKPCRAGVGGTGAAGALPGVRRRGRSISHPSGPVGPPCGPPWIWTSECRLWTNTARFHLISQKLSQNGEVSPKKCQKASHSPYFQNGSQNSPLDFLRFPYLPAFSAKELMGLF